jgi:ubiquinone/menaquinone biosynthesis C-methylase UbiE
MINSIQQLYGDYWGTDHKTADALIGISLNPRDMDSLYDLFAQTGCRENEWVLDIGCRDARHAIELARRFGCRAIGVDPVPYNIEIARELIANWSMGHLVSAEIGQIESLVYEDDSVDYIWSRDMLNHVDLATGLEECARVLKPGGWMMVYQAFAGEHLEPREAERIFAALSIVPENMSTATFEVSAAKAGFSIEVKDVVASEWRECWIENEDVTIADDLLQIARMRRAEAELVERIGRGRYEAELAVRLWGVYQLLGKLMPIAYLLRNSPG